jgi:hypothetical protein
MGTKDKQDHQPEPWIQDGRYILDASGWTLASTRFPADARRIIAAINAVQGIPTDALESWVVNVIGEPLGRSGGDRRRAGGGDTFEPVQNERRVGERRHGDRRASRPELRIFGSPPVYQEDGEGQDSQ